MLLEYQEVSDQELTKMSAENKLAEIRRVHQWLSDNYIRNNNNHNYGVYVYFVDIVQRLVGWER